MIKKVIALVFVSFFVMTGLSVLNQGNQNYNIDNNVNNFSATSSNKYFSLNLYKEFNISGSHSNIVNYENGIFYLSGSSSADYIYFQNYSNIIKEYTFNVPHYYSNISFFGENIYAYNYTEFGSPTNICVFNISTDSSRYITVTNSIESFYNCSYMCFLSTSIKKVSLVNGGISSISVSRYQYDSWDSPQYNILCFISTDNNNILTFSRVMINPLKLLSTYSVSVNIEPNLMNQFSQYNFSLSEDNSIGLENNTIPIYTPYSNTSHLAFSSMLSYNNYYFNPYQLGNKPYIYPASNTYVIFSTNTYQYQAFFNYSDNNAYDLGTSKEYITIFDRNTNSVMIFLNPLGNRYILNINSYTYQSVEINNYFLHNGIIFSGFGTTFINPNLPFKIIPLNTTYIYNGSTICITLSDFSGNGINKYDNVSIYYSVPKSSSIPLYNIFTYMYPISIIGLFVGMGAFIFTIKKRGYKIWIL